MKAFVMSTVNKLIEDNISNGLVEASLGMHEDWFWTAQTYWAEGKYANGKFNDEKVNKLTKLVHECRKRANDNHVPGSDLMENHDYKRSYKLQSQLPCSVMQSRWATPTLQLIFENGSDRMIDVSKGHHLPEDIMDAISDGSSTLGVSGPLSGPVQDNITPLEEKED